MPFRSLQPDFPEQFVHPPIGDSYHRIAILQGMENAEIEELLRELLSASNAQRVAIQKVAADDSDASTTLTHPLGYGAELVAEFSESESWTTLQSRQEHLERYARRIRACQVRLGNKNFTYTHFPNDSPEPKRLILARIQQFLTGLVDTSELYQMVLLRSGQLIASALPIDPLDENRLDLLHRQLSAAAQKSTGSAHGELLQPGIYALRFWYGASLIGFASGDYALDFVRHRSKLVSRELAHLLNLLDQGPDKPGAIAPIPD